MRIGKISAFDFAQGLKCAGPELDDGGRHDRPTSSVRCRGILTVGLASAIWIYLTAVSSPGDAPGYAPEESKQYLRALELYGGKANVLAAELRRWFDGLGHGRRLAYTVACLTMLLAGAFWFGAAASKE